MNLWTVKGNETSRHILIKKLEPTHFCALKDNHRRGWEDEKGGSTEQAPSDSLFPISATLSKTEGNRSILSLKLYKNFSN